MTLYLFDCRRQFLRQPAHLPEWHRTTSTETSFCCNARQGRFRNDVLRDGRVGLVALGSVCSIAAAAIKGRTFEALTAAGTAFMGTAAPWGYTSKPKV
jgi:hypothetical protein